MRVVVDLLFEVDTAPSPVTDLAVGPPVTYVERDVDAIDSSGELVSYLGMAEVADSDMVTFWSSPARLVPQMEFLTLDLGAVFTIGRVRLRSRDVTAATFPVDFDIEASSDNVNFAVVASMRDLIPSPATFHDVSFPPVSARFVRVVMTEVPPYSDGAFYTQVAEVVVEEPVAITNALTIRWTAPGDDGTIGRATSYDLRWSSSPIDGANFQAATPVASVPSPSNPGQSEEVLMGGLADEARLYFALKSTDDVGNVSALSNLAEGTTAGDPPAAIADLTATTAGLDSIDLSWTAPGDDGNVGTAATYDIRYSTSPITGGNFDAATAVPSPVIPQPAGTTQGMTVSGLASATTFYFAIKTTDGTGNVSPLSNVAVASTGDDVAPAAVINLSATVGGISGYTSVGLSALDSSGDLAASVSKEKATDGDVVTFWSSAGTSTPEEEYLTVDTGAVRLWGRVHLTSRNTTNLFPEDFDIRISDDDVSYVTVASETGFVSSPGMSYTFPFTAAMGRYVKLRVTKPRQYSDGGYYVQVAEMSVDEATSQADEVTLSWTSPGDDGNVGTASSYEVRYSTSPINGGNFGSGMLVMGVSAPQVAGSAETHVLTGLSAETLYYFALKTKDEAPNESGLSNVAQVQTVPVPPAAVTDLVASGATTSSVDLDWTATGDDGLVGQAMSYEVRYSTSPLTDENFGSATLVVSGVPSPSLSGQAESMTVGSLSASTMYYFGLRVHDDALGVSFLSNVVMLETLDNVVPSAVTDLTGGVGGSLVKPLLIATASSGDLALSVSKEKAVDGNAGTFWSSAGTSTPEVEFLTVDTGALRDLRQVDLIARNTANLFPEDFDLQVSENGVDFTTVVSKTGFVAAPGSRSSFAFSSVFARYVRLRVTKPRQYVDGGYYVQLAELEVYEFQSQAGSVLLSWTAPGDDGSVGQATSYDVRYSQSLITAGNFGSALEAVGEPSPSVAGSAESFVVTGLSAETGYYFALKTTDDSTNTSPISNVVMAYTPGTPPSSVTDLAVSNPTNTTVKLDWTSTGDDGLVGTAESYEIRYSTSPITSGNFSGGMLVGSPPVPSVSGSPETKTVGGLTPGETYYFALKVVDEAGNKSGLSNVVSGTTVDDIAPSTVTDLSALLGGVVLQDVPSVAVEASGELLPVTNVTDGDLGSFWSSLGSLVQREEFVTVDMGSMHLLGRVRLRSRSVVPELFPEDVVVEVSGDNVSYTPVHVATGLGIQASTWFTLDLATPTMGRYVRVRVTKMRQYVDGAFYAQIAEVETLETVTSVNVAWTAPGDDGSVGTASSYDLRYSTSPITAGNFDAATPVVGVPAPSVAGSAEAHTLGVLGGSTFYFALKTTDDDSNVSAISNLPSLVVF